MQYFGRRQNPLRLSDEELDSLFKYICDYFNVEWLKAENNHPLQVLWGRKDAMATNELYLLADALRNLSEIDRPWVLNQVKTIKGKDGNNRQGAFFELIGLNYMCRQESFKLKPTKINQAGFDATLSLANQHKINLSLKNYGQSSFNQSFEEKAKFFEGFTVQLAKKWRLNKLHVYIQAHDVYPEEANWNALRDVWPDIMRQTAELGRGIFSTPDNSWVVMVSPLEGGYDYHPNYLSYKFHVSAPHHKNEHKNLESKLDNACSNLRKHAAPLSAENRNVIYIHLPASASVKKCVEWANSYMEEFPEQPISYVLFYQPTISTNMAENTSHIHHHFRQSKSVPEGLSFPLPTWVMPVGIVSDEPTTLELHIGERVFAIEDNYLYQSGHYYIRGRREQDAETFDIQRRASGIFVHGVIENAGVISGIFSPSDDLLIV